MAQRKSDSVELGQAVRAGVGAGILAAAVSVGVTAVLHAPVPPSSSTAASAFTAGVLGGVLYAWLSQNMRSPVLTLWITSLAVATAISVVVARLPFPALPDVPSRIPLPIGLLVPLTQMAALVGIGRFTPQHFPAAYLSVAITQHYVTAVVVSFVVPRLAPILSARGRFPEAANAAGYRGGSNSPT